MALSSEDATRYHPEDILMSAVTETTIREALQQVVDPELFVNVVDLGLICKIAIEPAGEFPKLPTARALWVPRPDFTTSAESWLLAGGPHHTAYSQAVGLEVIEDFAEMIDVELLAIDADTTARGFRKEVRWTAAYRHLAGAI